MVDIADNGAIALKMIDKANRDQSPYQLLLTDIQMPEMDGYVLARTLRNRNSDAALDQKCGISANRFWSKRLQFSHAAG